MPCHFDKQLGIIGITCRHRHINKKTHSTPFVELVTGSGRTQGARSASEMHTFHYDKSTTVVKEHSIPEEGEYVFLSYVLLHRQGTISLAARPSEDISARTNDTFSDASRTKCYLASLSHNVMSKINTYLILPLKFHHFKNNTTIVAHTRTCNVC